MTTRSYSMEGRRAAAEATRERIVDSALDAFLTGWYDEVTLQEIARRAGVSSQTVLNHFGGKEALFAVAADRFSEQIAERRETPGGDVPAAVEAIVGDYE